MLKGGRGSWLHRMPPPTPKKSKIAKFLSAKLGRGEKGNRVRRNCGEHRSPCRKKSVAGLGWRIKEEMVNEGSSRTQNPPWKCAGPEPNSPFAEIPHDKLLRWCEKCEKFAHEKVEAIRVHFCVNLFGGLGRGTELRVALVVHSRLWTSSADNTPNAKAY